MSVSKRVTDPLQIQLFGAVQVLYQGQPLKFRSRKVLALLIYLAVEGGAHERDKLAALLWPESDQQQGRTALRVTLGRLRQALAVAGEFIITEGRRIGFDFTQTFELDVQMVDVVTNALAAATPPEAMQSALDHLRGEFLEGYSVEDAPDFESWASSQREWWHRRGDELFAAVGRQQLALAHFAAAVDTAIRWTHYAPFNESAHRCLIEAHALNGNRSAAWQAYAVCQQILADELGIDPSPETTALAARVKQGYIPRTDRPKMASPPATGQAAPAAVPQSPVIPLVGRAAEYGRLFATYQQAARGALQAAAIVGEAGMGKTRLAEALLDWAALETAPADVLRGRAFEIGGHLPYQPVVDALRQRLERENAPDDLLDDVWLAELSQLLPELRSRYPDLPPPLAGNADFVQARLFEAVAHLGVALAARQPLILFIDDLQWADAGSRELLHYLARRWSAQPNPILVLLTIRQEGLLTMPDLRQWLMGLGRDVPLTRLDLAPLTQHDLSELAQAMASDGVASPQFGDWLQAETGGSPFFVAELLQYLQQQSLLVAETEAAGQLSFNLTATLERLRAGQRPLLPPTIRDLILGRLASLSTKASALLLVGAVIGRRCTFERLCQVARLDEFDGLPALEELLQSRLMLENAHEARPFTFAHDNIRDVVYTEAGATRRRLYHRQTFAVLEQDKAPAAELTFHAAAAGLNQPAFIYAVAAGDEAMTLHAFADAVLFYEQALHLTEQVDVAAAQLSTLCTRYGRALELCGRYQDALDHYIEAIATARQSDNRELELAALVAQGSIRATANELSDFALGEALGLEALTLARALDDKAAEAKIQWNLLNVYRMTARNQQALAAGEQSLALAQELDLREQMAYAANDLVYVYQAGDDFDRMVVLAEMAAALWREVGNRPMLTDSLVILANMQAICGYYEEALTIAAEALQISRALENQWAISYCLYTYSQVNWHTLRVASALAAMKESIQLAHAVGFTGGQVLVRLFQAQLCLALGDLAQARALAEAASQIATSAIPLFVPAAQGVLCLVAIQEGQLDEAATIIVDHHFNELPFSLMNFFTPEAAICRYALSIGNYAQALTFSEKTLAIVLAKNMRMHSPEFSYLHGRALLGLGRAAEARAALANALAMLRETGGRCYFGEIADLLADLEEQVGNVAIAAAIRHEACTVLADISEQIPEGELRASFLDLPQVGHLLAC